MGCAFVAKIDSSKLAAGVWLKYLRDNKEKIKDNYLQHIERIVEFVSEYTGVHSCMQILAIFSS